MDGDARRRLSLLINAAAEAAQNSSSPLSSSWVTLNIDESGEPSPTPLIKALPEQLVGAPAAAPEQLVGAPAAAGARTVADLRPRSILTLADRLSVEEAAKRMAGMKTDAAVVVNNAGALIGILTDTDVTRKVLAPGLDPAAVHVTDAMTASPRCVLSTTSAVGALTTMVEHRFRHLPVLEAEEAGDGGGALRCVGLLDIAKCLYDAISAIDAAVTGGGAPTLGALLEAVTSEHGDAPAVVAAAATVQEAAAAMVARRSAVLVEVASVDGKTKSVAGIVTPKDLLNRVVARSLPAGATRVDAVMTPNPDTMPSSATVLQALHQLQYGGYRNLPVVSDADGRPLGVADVLSLMRGLTAGEAGAAPPPRRWRSSAAMLLLPALAMGACAAAAVAAAHAGRLPSSLHALTVRWGDALGARWAALRARLK